MIELQRLYSKRVETLQTMGGTVKYSSPAYNIRVNL
jgi:hypothetical protein